MKNILFGYITHLVESEIRNVLEISLYGSQDSTFHSDP